MKLARRSLDDPERLVELEDQLDSHISEVLAEAANAGYSTAEVLIALKIVCERQYMALLEGADAADDQA